MSGGATAGRRGLRPLRSRGSPPHRPGGVAVAVAVAVAAGLAVAVGAGGCAGVLGLRTAERRPFEHRAHVLKGINCLRCHAGIASAGDEGPLHVPGTSTCLECHAKPHDDRSCGGCHGEMATRQGAELARKYLRFKHNSHVARLRGSCVRCHQAVAREGEVLRPTMATCLGCHEHRDQFAMRNCDRCHADIEAEGVRPSSHIVHGSDFLPEHGVRAASARDLCQTCHSERFCSSCHGRTVAVLPERLRFEDPLRPGVHRAGFRARHPEEARGQPGLCQTCHAPRFCDDCHEDRGVAAHDPRGPAFARRSPHPPGWLGLRGQRSDHGAAARRDPSACAACHGGAGEALCVGCHRVGGPGGNPHAPGWSSTLDKRDVPCRSCHEGTP